MKIRIPSCPVRGTQPRAPVPHPSSSPLQLRRGAERSYTTPALKGQSLPLPRPFRRGTRDQTACPDGMAEAHGQAPQHRRRGAGTEERTGPRQQCDCGRPSAGPCGGHSAAQWGRGPTSQGPGPQDKDSNCYFPFLQHTLPWTPSQTAILRESLLEGRPATTGSRKAKPLSGPVYQEKEKPVELG